ncbi:unnamed protein product [Rhizophagus irregularis]|uniref:Uncharacterized protein n=1 Tax=Rhizophagus irregularis TaxID=588596 RepID=A0A2N1MJT6_9GLOM|nr:hypothetical protein RhiirC2_791171 [Rhizophagus irregularis]CAB4391272.1 unnamed protein product [Rhizophagus irregularis]CAB5371666.1 unnamed protein product [Rhizophagus irregularis]
MYPSQDNITSRSAHESNITGFMNNDCATTAIQTEHPPSINCNSCNHNNSISGMNKNDDIFLSHAIISPDHNNYQQSMPNNISNNNDIISPAHNDYQRQISNDASNENVTSNISPGNKYQQPVPNNVSSSQFSPQYNDQISPRSNVFPLLKSLGITINSPRTSININIIVPSTSSDILNLLQQDHSTYSNNSS